MPDAPTLADLYGPVLARLPRTDDDDPARLDAEVLARPPERLHAPALFARGAPQLKNYDGALLVDRVIFHADGDTHRLLGLLVLATVFHGVGTTVVLDVPPGEETKRHRAIEELVVEAPWSERARLVLRPVSLDHWYSPLESQFPLADHDRRGLPAHELPQFVWCRPDDDLDDPFDRRRTVVRGFGPLEGTVALAQTLLDFGLMEPDVAGYPAIDFEGPAGYQSANALGNEATFVLGYDWL